MHIVKITVTEKIKTTDNKLEQNKAQYDLDKHTNKAFALLSVNVSKYEFSTFIQERLLRKG